MIDEIKDNLTSNIGNIDDQNKNLNTRVKAYTKINRWTDNFLRFDFKLVVSDFFRMLIVSTFICLLYYNKYHEPDITIKENIFKIGEQTSYTANQVNIHFINNYSSKINLFIEELELQSMISFYPIKKVEIEDIHVDMVENTIFYFMYPISVILVLYFLLIFYQYYAQKNLFAATLLNMKVDLILLPFFYYRNKNGYLYIRLIRHQKQKNVFTSLSHLVVSNLFNLKELNEDDKLEVKFIPKKVFLYDYIEISYTLNSKTSKVKKVVKNTSKKNNNIEIEIDKANNKIDEVMNQVENSQTAELELLNLEELENLNI